MKLFNRGFDSSAAKFPVGSRVHIKSKEELSQLLNGHNEQDGCLFMSQMLEYCGKEFVVLKIIDNFFDEHRYKMYKTKSPLYILEGLICDGNIQSENIRCDRSCYLFWHEEWLESAKNIRSGHDDNNILTPLPTSPRVYSDKNSEGRLSCQLTNIQEIAKESSILNNIHQRLVKILSGIRSRMLLFLKILSKTPRLTDNNGHARSLAHREFHPGDYVKVKAAHEINGMLDKKGKYQGCSFSRRMYKHCDNVYRVLKPVTFFYDESKKKVCKTKNMVILENATCNGEFRLLSARCDRMCFFFWREEWLEKQENSLS